MKYIATIGEQEYTIIINEQNQIQINDEPLEVDFLGLPDTPLYSLILNGQSYDININENEDMYQVMLKGTIYDVRVEDERTRKLAGLKGGFGSPVGEVLIKAPMPGVVVGILVEEGQSITKGDVVVILESMKMQNEFKTPKDGVVSSIRTKIGDKVDQNAIMLTVS